MTKDHYMDILDQRKELIDSENDKQVKEKSIQENRGFVYKGNKMMTYCQSKEGLKYFYAKRIVLDDGLSTTYLNL